MSWELVHILSNAHLQDRDVVENDYLAIVPLTDRRLAEIFKARPIAKTVLSTFTEQFGAPIHPAVLLRNTTAPQTIDAQAIIAFRNTWAMCSIIYGWSHQILRQNVFNPLWSDFFDIYPVVVGREHLMIRSPAIQNLDEPSLFRGQTSPLVGNPNSLQFRNDSSLLKLILRAWDRRFVRGQTGWKTSVLFRSLAVAFQACRAPFDNTGIIYDIGTSLALWVSAFEVLTHPSGSKASLETVVNLLELSQWNYRRLRNKRYAIWIRNKSRRCSLISRLYYELYEARNDFLHGNKVTTKRLFPFKDQLQPQILQLAPLIYRVALKVYCQQFADNRRIRDDSNHEYFFFHGIEKSLLKVITKPASK